MTTPSQKVADAGEFQNLCYHIGLALVTWQRIEDVHFELFIRMLDVPVNEISAVVYYSVESFAARNTMLNRMAAHLLSGPHRKHHWKEWAEIHKLLKDGNLNRNKLAHYSADYDLANQRVENGSVFFDVTPHTLRPAPWNFVVRAGDDPHSDTHNVRVDQIKRYIVDFRQLLNRIDAFHLSLSRLRESSP